MEIEPVIIGGAFGLVNLALGIWLKTLADSIKSKVGQKEHDGTVARLERVINQKVDKGHCKLKEQLALEKFHSIEQLIDMGNSVNASDHDELKSGVSSVQDDIKATTTALAQINKCLALLSERISKKNTTDEDDE